MLVASPRLSATGAYGDLRGQVIARPELLDVPIYLVAVAFPTRWVHLGQAAVRVTAADGDGSDLLWLDGFDASTCRFSVLESHLRHCQFAASGNRMEPQSSQKGTS